MLIVVLTVQAIRLLWIAFAPLDAPATSFKTPGPATTAAAAPLASHGDVFHPGAGDSTGTTGYTVLGVRIAGHDSSAILARGGKQAAHAVGDEVAAGVVLAAVAADHVVLRAGGRRHRVALVQPAASTLPSPRPLPVGASTKNTGAANEPATVDPRQLLTETGLRPRHEGGRVTGYTVVPRGNEALLQRAGLQAGDVLLAVDGQPLDPEGLQDLKRELHGNATLTVRRDGQTRTLTLQAPK